MNISAIFFADDIVVIGKDSDALEVLMGIAREFFANHHLAISDTMIWVVVVLFHLA